MNRTDSPVWKFFIKLIQILYLSVLWIVFSLPVVTAGAATTALFYVSWRLYRNEEGDLFKNFWSSFKQNFLQATVIWAVIGLLSAFFAFDVNLLIHSEAPHASVLKGVYLGAMVLTLFVGLYVFAVLSHFENTIPGTFKNAALMASRHLPVTLAMAAIAVTVVLFSLTVFPPLLIPAPGLIVYLDVMLLSGVFPRYEPKE